MKWEHKCSLKWMKERQKYLCASEIKKLIPFTKTGRVRKIDDMDRLAIWASKQKILTEDDCYSFGAAARGHMLEPFAVQAFNLYAINNNLDFLLCHWDDVVISKSKEQGLGFSPDAVNTSQPHSFINLKADQFDKIVIGEIKCYEAEKHMTTITTPDKEREERWQIATAMAVCNAIDKAYLILFNPSMKICNLGVYEYTRSDLQEEIETILQIEEDWLKFLSGLSFVNDQHISLTEVKENEIIDIIERENRLNIS